MTMTAALGEPAGPPVLPARLPQRRHHPRPVGESTRSDRVTPRIDTVSACAGCDDLVVYDEVIGWIHTGASTAGDEADLAETSTGTTVTPPAACR
ncbi:hypothetical protein F4553_001950 [Allocatelliglobosispora scoriae]|uniref:Uncharacterized protein n=1 Tax=Allocatelliglobosispora scoriae TaxID=643052 RepID=A0A841BP14_9ACTN|nr:hypothetical protein [Allocatelliglobosispora scoriae]MBB5868571.1 hypothetical protein [Allocatelliglobosispora scoriae]